jgi:hypothetical protein
MLQVAGASAEASAMVCQRLLGSLLRAAGPGEPSTGSSLALTAMLALVRATRSLQPAAEHAKAALLAGKGPDILGAALRDSPAEAGPAGLDEEPTPDVQLRLVAELATFPAVCSPLGEPDQERAVRFLLACILQPSARSPAAERYSSAEAASTVVGDALADMARQGHTALLARTALPALLRAAMAEGSSREANNGDSWQGAGALAAISRIAAASESLCLSLRSALLKFLESLHYHPPSPGALRC